MIKTLADFKRLPEGTKLVLRSTNIDFMGKPHKYLGVERTIEHKQTNAIRFSGGSWLEYPKASQFSIDGPYVVISDVTGGWLAYEVLSK